MSHNTKSNEEIVNEFIETWVSKTENDTDLVFAFVNTMQAVEMVDWIRNVLTAKDTEKEEAVREVTSTIKIVNAIAFQKGYALAIRHFEERMQKGQPVFEAIDGLKKIHRQLPESYPNLK